MKGKIYRMLFSGIIVLTLFSYWAAFALLFVNKFIHNELPGYTIGRLCIWEFFALLVAMVLAYWMSRKWGTIRINADDSISFHKNYAL